MKDEVPMGDNVIFVATLVTALASGVVGGVFFGFSTFVIKALARLPAESGIAAMQSINVVVINPWFMIPFVGTAAMSMLLGAAALFGWGDLNRVLLVVGAVLYVLGVFGVTMAFNVPRNDALAAIDAGSVSGASQWAKFVPSWTTWNTVRTIAAIGAAASFTGALVTK
jgi:uncharacterized membrane protein